MGGDALLRLFLFWGMFLPLGARLSLDARREPALRALPAQYVSAATVALLGQVCLVYFATGAHKSGELWADGTAVRYALDLDPLVTGFGVWLRDHADALLPLATHGVVWFERLGPLLAFAPIATGPVRTATVALFFAFHLGARRGARHRDLSLRGDGRLARVPARVVLGRAAAARRAARRSREQRPRSLAGRWPVQLLVGALFAWVATSVIAAILGAADPLPRPIAAVGNALRIDAVLDDVLAQSAGARRLDRTDRHDAQRGALRRRARCAAAKPDKPERLSAQESWSWRIWLGYLQGLELDDPVRALVLDRLAEFSCRDWNDARPEAERFESIEIVQVIERTLPVGTAPLTRVVMLRSPCAVQSGEE